MLRRRHFPSNTLAKAGINTSQLSSQDQNPIVFGPSTFRLPRYREKDPANRRHSMSNVNARPIRSGDKVMRDTATLNQGKVQFGDGAAVFARAPPSAGGTVTGDATSLNQRIV